MFLLQNNTVVQKYEMWLESATPDTWSVIVSFSLVYTISSLKSHMEAVRNSTMGHLTAENVDVSL